MRIEPHRILKRSIITESTTALRESRNQVVFEVERTATKPAIKAAIEKIFGVKVEAVNTMIVRGKNKRVGRFVGKRPAWKKAIATLREGNKIEIFEGV